MKPFVMPPGVDTALMRAVKAANAYGYPSMQVSAHDGELKRVSFFDAQGNQDFAMLIDGEWFLYEEVPDGFSER